jgi:hypothetical protein
MKNKLAEGGGVMKAQTIEKLIPVPAIMKGN